MGKLGEEMFPEGKMPEGGCDRNCMDCNEPHAQGMDENKRKRMAAIAKMFFGSAGAEALGMREPETKFEPLFTVTPEQKIQWDDFEKRIAILEDQKNTWEAAARKLKTEKDLWWMNLREKLPKTDSERDTLKYSDGVVYGSVDIKESDAEFSADQRND